MKKTNKLVLLLLSILSFKSILSFQEFHGKLLHAYANDPVAYHKSGVERMRCWKTNYRNFGIYGTTECLKKHDEKLEFYKFLSDELRAGRDPFTMNYTRWELVKEWVTDHQKSVCVGATIASLLAIWATYEGYYIYKNLSNKEKSQLSRWALARTIAGKIPASMIKHSPDILNAILNSSITWCIVFPTLFTAWLLTLPSQASLRYKNTY